jgi:hypothetical protein
MYPLHALYERRRAGGSHETTNVLVLKFRDSETQQLSLIQNSVRDTEMNDTHVTHQEQGANDSFYGVAALRINTGYIEQLQSDFKNHARLMSPELVYDRDRRPSFPFISGDGFRSLCPHKCEERGCAFSPLDVKEGDCIFIATTNLETLRGTSAFIQNFAEMVHQIQQNFVVITHNGDMSSPDGDDWHANEESFYAEHYSHLLSNPRLIAWFASNCNWKNYPAVKPDKLVCIPIGIENRYNTIGNHPEKYFSLMQRRSQIVPHKRLLVAFTAGSYKPSRAEALMTLSAPWMTKGIFERDTWIQEVQENVFVACPTGHGYDTHRVWEVLMLGAIPVVPKSPIDSLYENLPVLIVNHWSDVDQAYLDSAHREILNRTDLQIEKMFFPYWKNAITGMASRQERLNNRPTIVS